MTFRSRSFLIFLSLFTVELLIARYVTQPFIRYWLGDFLVVVLIYYFFKSFIAVKNNLNILQQPIIAALLKNLLKIAYLLRFGHIGKSILPSADTLCSAAVKGDSKVFLIIGTQVLNIYPLAGIVDEIRHILSRYDSGRNR